MKKIISLEGAWAGGKTSILRKLGEKGLKVFYSVVPTIYDVKGRDTYCPKDDPREFTELFLKLKEEQHKEALVDDELVIFDRAFFAPIVLRRFLGLEIPGEFYDLAKNAGIISPVFLVEPIPLEKHKHGWPRKHFSYEESLQYHQITEEVVTELGFKIYKVKYSPVIDERAEDILHIIDQQSKGRENND